MLKIDYTIPATEYYDEIIEEFVTFDPKSIHVSLEHSLVAISKWEAKYHKPFLSNDEKTSEETLDYICMMDPSESLTIPDLHRLPAKIMQKIQNYIQDPMTATTFSSTNQSGREIITSEVIYYDMIAAQIPFECQYWHLNRLLTLLHICSIKNSPQKKMSKSEILARNRVLNAQRRAKMHTKG